MEAACRLVKGNNISICSEGLLEAIKSFTPACKRRWRRFVPHYRQTRRSKTGLLTPPLHFLPRMTSAHRSLPTLSIIPLFLLIEYLLAYLFLITDSRPPVPRVRGPCAPTVRRTAEPLVPAAPGGLCSGRPASGGACQPVNTAPTGYRSVRQMHSVAD